MERARATWTDERLDDLARHVDGGFARVDNEIRDLRIEVRQTRAELGGRIDGLQRTVLQVGAGIIATMLVGFASLLAAQIA